MEEFKIHPLFTDYAANRFGTIINVKTKRIISQNINGSGYYFFNPCLNKEKKIYSSHRFTYECFHGLIPNGLVIDHIDNNKTNNNLDNLQLLTYKQNSQKGCDENPNHKTIKEIIIVFEDGSEQKFRSQALAAKVLNSNQTAISMCKAGIYKSFTNRITGERYTVKKP